MTWRPAAAILLLLTTPLAGDAQPPAKVARIGVLTLAVPPSAPLAEAFRDGLREHGYVEGQNVALEYRYASEWFELGVADVSAFKRRKFM